MYLFMWPQGGGSTNAEWIKYLALQIVAIFSLAVGPKGMRMRLEMRMRMLYAQWVVDVGESVAAK